VVADVRVPGVDTAAIFVDTMPRAKDPKVWAGIFVEGASRTEAMAGAVRRQYGRIVGFKSHHYEVIDDNAYFTRPLQRTEYNVPIVELFERGIKDIGIYWSDRVSWQARPPKSLIDRTAEFFREMISAVENVRVGRAGKDSWSFKNRRIAVTTNVVVRSSAQAQRALARDRWTCQVCRLTPEQIYGSVGRACLEAHHIVALRTKGARKTTKLKDLISVCANCHRALGKLPPNSRGLAELRRRFRS
jgi:hypothetical protein